MTLRTLTIIAAAGLMALAAAAQDGQRPPERRKALRGQRGHDQSRIYDRIRKELDLSAEQQEQYDEIVARHRGKGKDLGMGNMRKIMKEMREARQAGDEQRVAELREKMREARRASSMEAFLDEVEQILNDEQRAKLAEIRERITARRGGRGPVAQLKRLRSELKLSEDQAQQYDELLEQLEEDLKKSRTGGEDVAEIIEQIREAAEAGDHERVRELRKQLPDPRRRSDELVTRFLEEVESFLEPEQQKVLQRFRRQMHRGRQSGDVRAWFRFVRGLGLDSDQREQLRELEREAAKQMRRARGQRGDTGAAAEEIKQQIRELLNDEQLARFDSWLEKQESKDRQRRPRRRGRPAGRGADTP